MIRRLQRTDRASAAPSRLQRLTRPAALALPALAAASALGGCVPYTTYRYTAFTPAARPIAWDGAVPERGEVHAEATVSHAEVSPELLPVEHSTALNLAAHARGLGRDRPGARPRRRPPRDALVVRLDPALVARGPCRCPRGRRSSASAPR